MLNDSILEFEAFMQKKLAMIQTQRMSKVDLDQPILQRKAQELLRLIPLIPLIDQLIIYYSNHTRIYNAFFDQAHNQEQIDSAMLQSFYLLLKKLRVALIKEQGICWAQLESLFRWWVKKPYAKDLIHNHVEKKLFSNCHQFYKNIFDLKEINSDICMHENNIANFSKIQFFNPHKTPRSPITSNPIYKERQSIRALERKENEKVETLNKLAATILVNANILRTDALEKSTPIYLKAIEKIEFYRDWKCHCIIHHP
jgi:hypothetical protein